MSDKIYPGGKKMNIEDLQKCLEVLKKTYYDGYKRNAKRLNDEVYGNLEAQHILELIAESEDILKSFAKDENKKFTEEDYRKLVTNTIVVFNNISYPIASVHEKANIFLMAFKDADISGEKTIGQVLAENESFVATADSKTDYVSDAEDEDFFEFNPQAVSADNDGLKKCMDIVADSKKGVWGGSDEFKTMENRLKELKSLGGKFNDDLGDEEAFEKYSAKLVEVREAAEKYIAYKVKQKDFKPKEIKRLEAAKKVFQFAALEKQNIDSIKETEEKKRKIFIDANKLSKDIGKQVYEEYKNPEYYKVRLHETIEYSKKLAKDGAERFVYENAFGNRHHRETCDTVTAEIISENLTNAAKSKIQEDVAAFERAVKGIFNSKVSEEEIKGRKIVYAKNVKKNPNHDKEVRENAISGILRYLNNKGEIDKEFLAAGVIVSNIMNSKSIFRDGEPIQVSMEELPDPARKCVRGLCVIENIAMKGLSANDALYGHSKDEFPKDEAKELLTDLLLYRMVNEQLGSYNEKHGNETKEYVSEDVDMNPLYYMMGEEKDVDKTMEKLKSFIQSTPEFKAILNSDIDKDFMSYLCNDNGKKMQDRLGALNDKCIEAFGFVAEKENSEKEQTSFSELSKLEDSKISGRTSKENKSRIKALPDAEIQDISKSFK